MDPNIIWALFLIQRHTFNLRKYAIKFPDQYKILMCAKKKKKKPKKIEFFFFFSLTI